MGVDMNESINKKITFEDLILRYLIDEIMNEKQNYNATYIAGLFYFVYSVIIHLS